jgi:hypothetical protein
VKLRPLTAIRTVVSVLVLVVLFTFVKSAGYNVAANPYYPTIPTFFPPYNQLFPPVAQFPEGPIDSPRFRPADSASPLPQDRAFFNYNFYGDINFTATQQATQCPRLPSFMSYPLNGQPGTSADQVIGSLFAGGLTTQLINPNVFGALDPGCFDFNSDGLVDSGDLTIVAKYACINDADRGSVLSTGLQVTLPNGLLNVPPLYSLTGRLTGGGICDITGNLFLVPRGCAPRVLETDAFATCP